MHRHVIWFVIILLLALFSVWVVLPTTRLVNIPDLCYTGNDPEIGRRPDQGIHLDLNDDCVSDLTLNVQQSLGLDIVGGLRVLLQADLPGTAFTLTNLQDTANNVSRRVNALGVGEATIQVQGSNRILVELPGVTDPQQAVETIQQTALLEFVDFAGIANVQQYVGRRIFTTEQQRIQQARAGAAAEITPEPSAASIQTPVVSPEEQGLPNPNTGQPFATVMTGSGLQSAAARLGQLGQQWEIDFQLKTEGGIVFGPFTGNNVGNAMAIVLDGIVLSAPTIQARLDSGGVISGAFTQEEAQTLSLQLRSGALPIPLRVISSESVGATLGQESVNLSIRAGLIGVVVILIFMVGNYRVPGMAASLALLVFILFNLAVFKLIPVTLTLPAIIGFLISIGGAVDGNILIFERIREELRGGKDPQKAVEEGFSRAWSSIRDSNISTILISTVLFLFGQTPGASIVSGFAVTLILGMSINLFTATIVTRTFLNLMLVPMRRAITERAWLMGV
jgi:protein-export membrane protein SecD